MGSLIVILPILVIAGAFMWLRPSKRDQELARLRSEALVRGFRIGSIKVPDMSEYGRVEHKKTIVTVYQKTLIVPKEDTPAFVAVRTTGDNGAYLPEGWAWHDRRLLIDAHYEAINAFVSTLPPSITVVALERDSVALSWDERDPQVSFEALEQWLTELAAAFKRNII